MKIQILACAVLISQCSAWKWPGSNSAVTVDSAPEPQVPAEPSLHDPFAPSATVVSIPEPSYGAAPSSASSTLSSIDNEATSTQASTKPQSQRPSVPTPQSWFNGAKPLAFEEYTGGPEYSFFNKHLVFRPLLFSNELFAILGIAAIGLLGSTRKNSNWQLAKAWMEPHIARLEECFEKLDVGSGRYLKEVDNSTYIGWATGRKGIKALRISLNFRPRADVFVTMYEMARRVLDFTYQASEDKVTLDFLLETADNDEWIAAVIDKSHMKSTRAERWDLTAFTTLSETEISKKSLPSKLAVFSETGSVGDTVLKNQDIGLAEWLSGSGEGQEYFESLIISDLAGLQTRPDDAILISPTPLSKDRRLTITLRLPSRSQSSATLPPLTLAINLADALASGKLSIEANQGRRKRRQEIIDAATSDYKLELKEKVQEEALKKKKQVEEAAYNALSPDARKKKDELEQKRKVRKQQMRQASKGAAGKQ